MFAYLNLDPEGLTTTLFPSPCDEETHRGASSRIFGVGFERVWEGWRQENWPVY